MTIWSTLFKDGKIFMNSESSKKSEPHRFRLNLTNKPDLKDPKKKMALANLSIY